MLMLSETDLHHGPSPTIHQPYRIIRTALRGRLGARTDPLGTLQLHLEARTSAGSKVCFASTWRSGPLRRCEAIFGALQRALAFLGEQADTPGALQMSRRIGPALFERLGNFSLVDVGRYQQLADQVRFADPTPATGVRRMPACSWVVAKLDAASVQGSAGTDHATNDMVGTFMLARRHRSWELWKRSNNPPCRRRTGTVTTWMCAVDLLHEEPHYAGELLLYALLQHQQCRIAALPDCSTGLIPAARMEILRRAMDSSLPEP